MRDRRSWSCTEESACSACIALLHLRWILFCAAAPQSRGAPLYRRVAGNSSHAAVISKVSSADNSELNAIGCAPICAKMRYFKAPVEAPPDAMHRLSQGATGLQLCLLLNPSFATRAPESSKRLVFCCRRCEGRHHSAGGHADRGTSAPSSTLGGGWAGRVIFSRWSRMAWSASGSVYRESMTVRPSVV